MLDIVKKLRSDKSQRVSEAVTAFRDWSRSLHAESGNRDSVLRGSAQRIEMTLAFHGADEAALIAAFKSALRNMFEILFRRSLDQVFDGADQMQKLFACKYRFLAETARLIQSSSSTDANILPSEKRAALRYVASQLELLVHGVSRSVRPNDLALQRSLGRVAGFIAPGALAPSVVTFLRQHGAAAANRVAQVAAVNPAAVAALPSSNQRDDVVADNAPRRSARVSALGHRDSASRSGH